MLESRWVYTIMEWHSFISVTLFTVQGFEKTSLPMFLILTCLLLSSLEDEVSFHKLSGTQTDMCHAVGTWGQVYNTIVDQGWTKQYTYQNFDAWVMNTLSKLATFLNAMWSSGGTIVDDNRWSVVHTNSMVGRLKEFLVVINWIR